MEKLPASDANEQLDDIKVSVTVLTYNHFRYIRQTIDSILAQRTDFRYEVLIGDDASQDGTPEILLEYAEKYQHIIKLFLREKNLGATRNAYELVMNAKGRYIASLDGDDFWTDSDKLQIQADFLDKNPEFIGCTHEYEMVDECGNIIKHRRLLWASEKDVFKLNDLKGVTMPGHSSTMMKRNIFLKPKHDYSIIYKAHPMICDLTSALIFLAEGDFYRINRCMGAYRYVRKIGSGNIISMYLVNEQKVYDDYLFVSKLHAYARDVLRVEAGFGRREKEIFANAVCSFILKPTKLRLNIVKKILLDATNPLSYIFSLLFTIPLKIYRKIIYR